MSLVNGPHGPWHPIEHLTFWKTMTTERGRKEIVEMAAVYDELTRGDPALKQKLDDLIAFASGEAVTDDLYNREG